MAIPYVTLDRAKQIAKEYGGVKGEGKNWIRLDLSLTDLNTLTKGGEILKISSTEYDPSNFKNDYFDCRAQVTTTNQGTDIEIGDDLEKVYININNFVTGSALVQKLCQVGIQNYGFDHNYYKTFVLYAGYDGTTVGAEPILEGNGVLDGNDVIYVQDVTRQEWEYNTFKSEKDKEVIKEGSEVLGRERYGEQYVFSIKGATGSATAFLVSFVDDRAAAWYTDEATGTSKLVYANVSAGKIYPVTFDGTGTGTHNTQRWLLTSITTEGSGENQDWNAVEMTETEKGTLLNTGITFTTGRKAAKALIDTNPDQKVETSCMGVKFKETTAVLSFNKEFEVRGQRELQVVGRPSGYYNSIVYYTMKSDDPEEEPIVVAEKDGEYVWTAEIDGLYIELFIPDNCDEDGKPHRNRFIIRSTESSSESTGIAISTPAVLTSTTTLYRHTFTITPKENYEVEVGGYEFYISFCAVNAQAGESSIEYILHSDETGNTIDWMLPVSGVIRKKTAEDTWSNWFTAGRIKAGWSTIDEKSYRTLFIDYVEPGEAWYQTAAVITDLNKDDFYATDFRSAIATVNSPSNEIKVIDKAAE